MSAPLSTPSRTLFPWHILLMLVGGMILTVGCFCAWVAVASALAPASPDTSITATGWWFFLLLIVLPMLFTGGASLWLGGRQLRMRQTLDRHHRILRLADVHNYVTAADVARELTLPITTAEQMLNDLASQGLCHMEMNAEGVTSYRFPRRVIP